MEAVAYVKYLKISPKKVRELAKLTVGLKPEEAENRLILLSSKASRLLTSSISSARNNAVNNLKMDPASLIIKSVSIQKGPFLKRWQPVSRGVAHRIKKRTSHIKVTLNEVKPVRTTVKPAKNEKKIVKKHQNNNKKIKE